MNDVIKVRLSRETDTHAEYVWATALKNGNYRIESDTHLTNGVQRGDIIKVEWINEMFVLKSIVIKNLKPSSNGKSIQTTKTRNRDRRDTL